MQTVFNILEKADKFYETYDTYATLGSTVGVHVVFEVIKEQRKLHQSKIEDTIRVVENVQEKAQENKEKVGEIKEKQEENAKDLKEKSKKGLGSLKNLKNKGKDVKKEDLKDIKTQGEEIQVKVEEIKEDVEEIVEDVKEFVEDISKIPKKKLLHIIFEGVKSGIIVGGVKHFCYKYILPRIVKKITGQDTIEKTNKNSLIQLGVQQFSGILTLIGIYSFVCASGYILISTQKPNEPINPDVANVIAQKKQLERDFKSVLSVYKLIDVTSSYLVFRYIPAHYHVMSFQFIEKMLVQIKGVQKASKEEEVAMVSNKINKK